MRWRDWLMVTKPRVVLLMLLTVWVAMLLACKQVGGVDAALLWRATVGIGLMAAAGGAMNQWVDQKADAKMARTHKRPLPDGRLLGWQVMLASVLMMVVGFLLLYIFVNPLTAWLTLASHLGYAGVYTVILKPLTPQNIVIGGLSGAMPPLLGWAAVTASVDYHAYLLVLIIYLWTPPHFWALALYRMDEYRQIAVPTFPIVYGERCTQWCMLSYAILLLLSLLLPVLIGWLGWLYALGAGLASVYFFAPIVQLLAYAGVCERLIFKRSIVMLMWVFLAMLCDQYIRLF